MSSRPLDPATRDRLASLGPATIYEAQGQRGAVDASIKPLDPASVVVGRALTVDVGPGDNLMLHAALLQAQPGDVVVADAHGFTDAGAWGDVLTVAAQQVGVVGLVINGSVRDGCAITDLGFPVFAKGLCIRGTTKTYRGTIGDPVDLAGTLVATGDVIVGDRDGLVVIAADELETSVGLAERREEKETEFRRRIESGASTAELLGLSDTLRAYDLV